MPKIFTKEILACQTFVNVQFNGVLQLLGQSKFEGLTLFSRCKSREGGYRVRYGRTLKLYCRRRLYGVYIRYVKRYRVCH